MTSRTPLAIALLVLSCGVQSTLAQDANQAALNLIEEGWRYNFSLMPKLESQYQSARSQFPADAKLVMAMGVVHLKYSRFEAAFDDATDYAKLSADDPNALRMQAWLATSMGKYDVVLSVAEELSRNLPAPQEADDPQRQQIDGQHHVLAPQGGKPTAGEVVQETEFSAFTRSAYVRFLGAEFGFLQGPAADEIPQQQVGAVRAAVLANLQEAEQKIFLDAENAVDQQFTLFSLERDQLQDEAKEQENQVKALETQRLLLERQIVAADKAALEAKETQYAATRDAALAQLDEESAEVESSIRELRAAGNDLQRQIVAINVDIARLLDLADRTRDPRLARRYRLEADSLVRLQDARRFDLRNVRGSLDAANAALQTINAKRRGVLQQYQAATRQLKRDIGKLNAKGNRITLDLQKLAKPATGLSPQVRNITRRAETIVTYINLPVEAMKKRLVAKLQAGQ